MIGDALPNVVVVIELSSAIARVAKAAQRHG
ncbi:hypothetical protein XOCgx_0606 [Xanthomonas oryzae pv. oryzicola]|nr:hypothetical protein XOCgx_0606 [Xanthomonas oryzae pv. oryzicola]